METVLKEESFKSKSKIEPCLSIERLLSNHTNKEAILLWHSVSQVYRCLCLFARIFGGACIMNDNYEATMFRGGFGQLYLDGWEQGLIRKIVRELQMGGSPTALDLGAGEGRMSALMSKLGYSVVSVDRSKRACKSLSRRSRSECFSVVLSDMTC